MKFSDKNYKLSLNSKLKELTAATATINKQWGPSCISYFGFPDVSSCVGFSGSTHIHPGAFVTVI